MQVSGGPFGSADLQLGFHMHLHLDAYGAGTDPLVLSSRPSSRPSKERNCSRLEGSFPTFVFHIAQFDASVIRLQSGRFESHELGNILPNVRS